MLVIHWAKHNKTNSILANGIRPSFRRRNGDRTNTKGVYVYPFTRNKTLVSNWRRNLKTRDKSLGNYNGFVFRLESGDFPLIAGHWFFNRLSSESHTLESLKDLAAVHGEFFTDKILETPEGDNYNWADFEIIIPRQIKPNRIIKVLKDREPKKPG